MNEKRDTMNTVPVLLAAASLVVTKDELNEIAEYYNYFGEMSEAHFDSVLSGKDSYLTRAPKILNTLPSRTTMI